jgi:hypothetical protein
MCPPSKELQPSKTPAEPDGSRMAMSSTEGHGRIEKLNRPVLLAQQTGEVHNPMRWQPNPAAVFTQAVAK